MNLRLEDTPNALIKFFTMDYPEIPSVLTEAEKKVPKYKGSVQPYQAAFLYWLTAKYVPTYGRILEIGTGLGYTSWIMATAKPKSLIDTLNPNSKECDIAEDTLRDFPNVQIFNKMSNQYYGDMFDADKIMAETTFDLIFVDGNHKDIAYDCKWRDHLTDNGIIVFHDYSPLDSWSPCLPVYNHLNKLKNSTWGEPTHTVIDDGNVGMIAWQNYHTEIEEKREIRELELKFNLV